MNRNVEIFGFYYELVDDRTGEIAHSYFEKKQPGLQPFGPKDYTWRITVVYADAQPSEEEKRHIAQQQKHLDDIPF